MLYGISRHSYTSLLRIIHVQSEITRVITAGRTSSRVKPSSSDGLASLAAPFVGLVLVPLVLLDQSEWYINNHNNIIIINNPNSYPFPAFPSNYDGVYPVYVA